MRIADLLRATILGFVGFISPMFAIAMGLPLDQWIVDAASAVKVVISQDQAVWGMMLFGGIVLASAELWWHPLRRLGQPMSGPAGSAEADVIRAQAELEKQRRLTLKEQRVGAKPTPSAANELKMARRWIKFSKDILLDVDHYGASRSGPIIDYKALPPDQRYAVWEAERERSNSAHASRMRALTSRFQGPISHAKQEMIDRKIPLNGALGMQLFRPVNDFDFIEWANKLAAEGGKLLDALGEQYED